MAKARKVRLSKRKAGWAAKFKPAAVKGPSLGAPTAVEARYQAALRKLTLRMLDEVEREVEALFTSPTAEVSHVATDASISSQSRILMNALQSRFALLFSRAAAGLAEGMVGQAAKASASSLGRSLRELSGGVAIKTDVLTSGPVAEVVKASVAENVGLIKSIPAQYLDDVRGAVMRSITTGNGLADLQPYLVQQRGVAERRAKNLALDQTRKAYQSINAERMKAAGIKKFEWVHSGGGQKPRPLHVEMNGNVYSYDNLPVIDERTGERGIPGQAVNCRCTARPVLELE